jgi:RimJ/RimL family protein N-acetyltransferase
LDHPLFHASFRLVGREVGVRPLEENDAAALARAAAGLKARHPFSFVPEGNREAEIYVRTALGERARGERYPFVIEHLGEIVGSTSYLDFSWWPRLDVNPDYPAAVEIGATWLAQAAQRTRCNTEAKLLLLAHAFDTWRAERVSFRTDERNARSRAAIERLGARFEGVRRAERLGADGAVRNSAWYSIVAPEWPEVRAGLQERLDRGPTS